MAIQNYWYDGQVRQFLLQFVAIFHGLQVQTGKGECDVPEMISVPVVVGNKDRVVAAILQGNTHNRMFSLPTMAVHINGLEIAEDRRRAPGMVDQRTHLEVGGIFPNDLTVVKRVMPVPYNMAMELSIYASNSDQLWQILEQILVLFNPDIQIQKSDGEFDWTKITRVILTDINNEENYPTGTDRRLTVWTLNFLMPIWLSIPMGARDDLVRKIIIQIGELDTITLDEVDDEGNITPFGSPLARIELDGHPVQGVPGDPEQVDREENL